MPIEVIKVEKHKNHFFKLSPGLSVSNDWNNSSNESLIVNKKSSIHRPPNGYGNTSTVYLKTELDSKITTINSSITKIKQECNLEISNSLTKIQTELINLKRNIVLDESFKENIINTLMNNDKFLQEISQRISSNQ